jgi:sugar lactone lactonase YvrE
MGKRIMNTHIHRISCPNIRLGESPRWAHQQLRWIDIPGQTLYRLDDFPQQLTPSSLALPDQIGALLPTIDPSLWLGFGRQGIWKIHDHQAPELWLNAPFSSQEQRFNDGRSDAKGRAWVSTLVDARTPGGKLYCLEQSPLHSTMLKSSVDHLIVGNGLAFSPDYRRLYLADTRQRCVWHYAFDLNTGELGERHLFVEYTVGTERPDGAAVSEDGHYWVAVMDGARIDRWSPEGKLIHSYSLPVHCPTMPCFAGKDRTLLAVTSVGLERPEEERQSTLAGDVLFFEVDIPGCKEEYVTCI